MKKRWHFVGMELTPEGQRREKYLPNENFPTFPAQKTADT